MRQLPLNPDPDTAPGMKKDGLLTNPKTDNLALPILTTIKHRYHLLLAAILIIFAIVQAALISRLPLTYNDGLNLQVSQLINRGYQPYTQIFTLAAPLFVWFVGKLGQFNLSPGGFKLVFLGFSLLLLINTSMIARALLGEKVALVSVFLLATATTFLAEAATTIVATPLALSIATLSVVGVLR